MQSSKCASFLTIFLLFVTGLIVFPAHASDFNVHPDYPQHECSRNGDFESAITSGFAQAAEIASDSGPYVLKPFNLHLSISGSPTGQLAVLDSSGNTVTEGVSFHGYDASLVSVSPTGLVTALRTENPSEIGTWIQASVDSVEVSNTTVVRVLSRDVDFNFIEYEGKVTNLYSPNEIDGEDIDQYVAQYQIPLVNDYAYWDQLNLMGTNPFFGAKQIFEVDFGESETNRVCGISGNPLRLGWNLNGGEWANCYLVPFIPPRSPQWFIFYHEAGHNTTWNSYVFGQGLGIFEYSEGVASYLALTGFRRFAEHGTTFPMGLDASLSMAEMDNELRSVFLNRYQNWLADGAPFVELDPDLVDGILLHHEAVEGECFAERFFNFLQPNHQSTLQSTLDKIETPGDRHTFFAALCSAAAQTDLYPEFSNDYHYPLDSDLYENALTALETLPATSAPMLVSPGTGATQIEQPLTLDWTVSPGAIHYDLYLGEDFPPPLYRTRIPGSEATLTGFLTLATDYYWQVKAQHPCLGEIAGDVFSFHTGGECSVSEIYVNDYAYPASPPTNLVCSQVKIEAGRLDSDDFSEVVVTDEAAVIYQAPEVVIKNGFRVELGGLFLVMIH